jgi:integrase
MPRRSGLRPRHDLAASASLRVVPLAHPVHTLLRAEYLRQGRPSGEARVCPPRRPCASGELSTAGVQRRARELWSSLDPAPQPIGLHECRHTAATWLNAAGVNPKVASVLMGHSTPERVAAAAAGAAGITLSRYTHALPDDLERARLQLDAYLARCLDAPAQTGT